MSKFEILSVAEDNNKSNCLSAEQTCYKNGIIQSLYLSVNTDRDLVIRAKSNTNYVGVSTTFRGIDVDSLIEYLQDVKIFLSEEDMVKKLMGKR